MTDGDRSQQAVLERRVALVSRALAAHGGGIEIAGLDDRGTVRLRFTGLCAGCQLRPLTFAETVEPAIAALDGVTAVEADGARISEHALARLRRYRALPALAAVALPA
ncbi:MAG: NifU family protein [Solirubrobacteraceae bacterium]